MTSSPMTPPAPQAWWQPRAWPRLLRHLWRDADDSRRVLPAAACARLTQAVRDSEAQHLGELRLCIEAGLPWAALRQGQDAHQRALDLFGLLRVWDTPHNNGVLIYVLLADRRIEVLADRGLHALADPTLWPRLCDELAASLRAGQAEAGLLRALQQVTGVLKAHHPAPADGERRNDLPDTIILL